MATRFFAPLRVGVLALAASTLLSAGALADTDNPLGTQGLSQADAGRIQYFIQSWFENLHFGNTEEYAKGWTDDGVLAPPGGGRIVGPQKISAYMRNLAEGTMQFEISSASIAGRGDLAVVANTIVWDVPGTDVIATERFNQLIVLRKDDTGAWKVQSMIYNAPDAAEN
ncbi:MAG: hypothetical protein AcusKO_43530 [Acuticoccus sp.]